MKASDLPNDELVKFFIELRDRRAGRKKEFEIIDGADKEKQEKIEGLLLQRYNAAGIESARTQYGTAYKTTVTSVSVADRDAFLEHVKQHGAFELLDVRANKTGVTQYADEHKELPPGVDCHTEVRIRVQRS